MAEAIIEFELGGIKFKCKGEQDWVTERLQYVLDKAPELIDTIPPILPAGENGEVPRATEPDNSDIAKKPLVTFLKESDATKVQVRKFLATSVWLHARGRQRLKTTDVTAALREASQRKLKNASDSLNKNVAKGYCEKDGSEFFVTEEGKASLSAEQ